QQDAGHGTRNQTQYVGVVSGVRADDRDGVRRTHGHVRGDDDVLAARREEELDACADGIRTDDLQGLSPPFGCRGPRNAIASTWAAGLTPRSADDLGQERTELDPERTICGKIPLLPSSLAEHHSTDHTTYGEIDPEPSRRKSPRRGAGDAL